MKKSLLSLLTVLTIVATSALVVKNNLQQNMTATSLSTHSMELSYFSVDYDKIRSSNDFSEMKTKFAILKLRVENWGWSVLPIVAHSIWWGYVDTYNEVSDLLKKVMTKIDPDYDELNQIGWFERVTVLAGGAPAILVSIRMLNGSFYNTLEPAYNKIIELVS